MAVANAFNGFRLSLDHAVARFKRIAEYTFGKDELKDEPGYFLDSTLRAYAVHHLPFVHPRHATGRASPCLVPHAL